jgi:hypothetical protein
MSFSHALVRSTLLDELSTTRRVRLHRQIGEALERRGNASAAELAHHFSEAAATGVADKALEHAVRAAEEAHGRVAYDEVVHFYSLALEALDAGEDDEVTRATLLIERGYAQHERNDADAGRTDALAAAEVARRLGHAGLIGRAGVTYLGLVGHWAAPHDPVAVELMREGLAGLGEGDDADRARVTAALANALVLVPGDEALVLSEKAERLAREVGDDHARYVALQGWSWALRSRGRAEDLCRIAASAVEHSVAAGRPEWEFTSRYLHGEGRIASCDLDAATAEMDLAGSFPSVLRGWAPVILAASRAIAAGQLDEAEELIDRAAPLGAALGETNDVITWTQHLGVAMSRGDFDQARAWMERLDQTLFGVAGGWRMFLLAEAGELDAALEWHAAWERDVRPLVPQVIMPWTLEAETNLAYRTGDATLAARLRDDVAPFAGHMLGGDTALLGLGDFLIGRVAFVEGRYDDAVAATTRAIEMSDRWSLDRLTTNHRIDLARTLVARGDVGDDEGARSVLTEALATAERLGLAPAAAEARALLG